MKSNSSMLTTIIKADLLETEWSSGFDSKSMLGIWYRQIDAVSVTRFGKISALWHNFKSLGQIFEGLFSIWQNYILSLAKCYAIGQDFIAVDGHIL